MDWIEFGASAGPYLFGGGGCVAVLKVWVDGRKVRTDLVHIAQEAAGAVIADLRLETDRLRKRLEEVEAEFTTFRKAHDTMIADKDAELALLRGRVTQLQATIDAYRRLLEANNIPYEPPRQPFYELTQGEVLPRPLGPGLERTP